MQNLRKHCNPLKVSEKLVDPGFIDELTLLEFYKEYILTIYLLGNMALPEGTDILYRILIVFAFVNEPTLSENTDVLHKTLIVYISFSEQMLPEGTSVLYSMLID